MKNMRLQSQIIGLITLVTLMGSLVSSPVRAETKYEPGAVVQALDSGTIYYIGSDGRRYGIPNMAVYHSWYANFSTLKSVPTEHELSNIGTGQSSVTVRPGTTLVRFGTESKIYAVDGGATIRWLTSAAVAEQLYGLNWQSWVVPLPARDRGLYTLGQDIREAANFSRPNAIAKANSIEDELRARHLIRVWSPTFPTYTTVADASFGEPLLRSLQTDSRHGLSPYFQPGVSTYKLTGEYKYNQLTLTPTGFTNLVEISVNDTAVPSGSPIALDLNTGLNSVVIVIRTPNGRTQTYTILVDRIPLNTNPYLQSIRHNLHNQLVPAFNPNIDKYDLRTDYLESSIVVTPSLQDNRGQVFVNDVPVRYGNSQTIALSPGDNKIYIRAKAEDGTEKIYTLTVYRTPWPRPEDLELVSLQESLPTAFSPKFDAHMSLYDLTANQNDGTVTITARPRSHNATIYINGEEGQTRIVPLFWGETKITVTVALGVGATRDYVITVDRQER